MVFITCRGTMSCFSVFHAIVHCEVIIINLMNTPPIRTLGSQKFMILLSRIQLEIQNRRAIGVVDGSLMTLTLMPDSGEYPVQLNQGEEGLSKNNNRQIN